MSRQSATTVLLVEDDESIRELLAWHLDRSGFTVLQAGTTEQADSLVAAADVVVLDWMLPGESGAAWLARRSVDAAGTPQKPVLMLTARATESDKVQGLDSGADDYLTKPFSNAELVARLRALLRRSGRPASVTLGPLSVRGDEGLADLNGIRLELTRREFDLLAFLAANAGRVCSRNELLDRVWGEDFLGTERTVDQHVAQLRSQLGSDWIATVRGRGYRLEAPRDNAG